MKAPKRNNHGRRLTFRQLAPVLADLVGSFHRRGWAPGTSGNFSVVLSRKPLELAITPSGVDKGLLRSSQLLRIDASGRTIRGAGRPSAETALHLAIVRARSAGAVLHTHSVWSTLLSETYAPESGLAIEGYEMLKGLEGVTSHEHREWLPILENSQDIVALARAVEQTLAQHPRAHGLLLRRHGLYTWGSDLPQAKRHVEILEFLLEVLARARTGGHDGSH